VAPLGPKPGTRIHGDSLSRSRDSVQELRLRETVWNYARNRVTAYASFCRANPVSFSRAPQPGGLCLNRGVIGRGALGGRRTGREDCGEGCRQGSRRREVCWGDHERVLLGWAGAYTGIVVFAFITQTVSDIERGLFA
jgi:hypothetical protein